MTATAMTNNFRPNDLKEIIVVYPPLSLIDLLASAKLRALQKTRNRFLIELF